MKFKWRSKKGFLLVFLVILILFLLTPWGKVSFKTALLTSEVIPNFPIKPLKLLTKAPKIEEVIIREGDREIKADLYRPDDSKKHEAIILTLGALTDRKNPALVNLSQALSRTGFVVLVPDLPQLASGHVITSDVEDSINIFNYLYKQSFVNQKKIGFGGFCVGSSLAIVAAQKKEIASKVSFINAISPYYDLKQLSAEITSKSFYENGKKVAWEPAPLTIETLKTGAVRYFSSAEDQEILKKGLFTNSVTSEERVRLSAEALGVLTYMESADLDQADEVFKRSIPPKGQEIFAEISPSTRIKDLRAHLFVLSDESDTFVPPTHGENFAKNLPKDRVTYTKTDSLEHVVPGTRLKLLRAINQIIKVYSHVWNFFNFVN